MKILIAAILLSLSFSANAGQMPDWMQSVTTANYDCNKKYCKNMSSCSEAYYRFKTCGQKKLDRDDDGIPCENVCGKTISQMNEKLKRGR